MTVSDNTIQAESLGDFFKKLAKRRLNVTKKTAENVLTIPGPFLNFLATIATAAASKNPKAVLSSLLEVINVYHTGKGLYLSRFIYFHSI